MFDEGVDKSSESKIDSQHYSAMDNTYSRSTIDTTLKAPVTKQSATKTKAVKNTISNDKSTEDGGIKRSNKSAVRSTNSEMADAQSTPEAKPSIVRDMSSLVIRRTRQTLKNNWNAKLASLILAILVWSIISASEQATRQLTVLVPLTVLGQPIVAEAYPLPTNVEVKLSGPNTRLDDLKLRDLTATIDLRNISGDFQARVRVTGPRGIDIETYDPRIVAGRVE